MKAEASPCNVSNMRLPDINHVSPQIYGTEYIEGPQLPPIFSQGTDIDLQVHLKIDGQVVHPDNYKLEVVMKKSHPDVCVVWEGEIDNGLYHKGNGLYRILIPSEVTKDLQAHTYWMDIVATSLKGVDIKDIRTLLATHPVMVIYTPSSPNSPGVVIVPDPIHGN